MNPDDPRHGTVAGHIAHQREDGNYCLPCITAKARYDKRRKWDAANGRGYTVPSLGARRRIEALQALGWSRQRIAEEAGWTSSGALRYVTRSETMTRATHDRIADAYERLCMKYPDTQGAARARTWAKRHGHAPPLAWDDIDDIDEKPGTRAKTAVVTIRERTWDSPDHRACARCGVVRETYQSKANPRGDLCRDCIEVEAA